MIYSMAAGDEPTALMELYTFAMALGLEIVAAGKGKNNPLNRDAVPDEYVAEAARRGLNPHMLVEFVDGSKTMIEMACFAKATGLTPDVPDMHGPNTSVPELKNVFRLRQDGGILGRKGVVDYAVGKVAPGVFLVVSTPHPRLRQCLVLRDMGPGPTYTLFRPFHLCSMEVPLTVAEISLYGRACMQPLDHLSTEVTKISGAANDGAKMQAQFAAGLEAPPPVRPDGSTGRSTCATCSSIAGEEWNMASSYRELRLYTGPMVSPSFAPSALHIFPAIPTGRMSRCSRSRSGNGWPAGEIGRSHKYSVAPNGGRVVTSQP